METSNLFESVNRWKKNTRKTTWALVPNTWTIPEFFQLFRWCSIGNVSNQMAILSCDRTFVYLALALHSFIHVTTSNQNLNTWLSNTSIDINFSIIIFGTSQFIFHWATIVYVTHTQFKHSSFKHRIGLTYRTSSFYHLKWAFSDLCK